jgi:hypothetical protein
MRTAVSRRSAGASPSGAPTAAVTASWDVRTARNDAASWALPFALGLTFRLARPPRRD